MSFQTCKGSGRGHLVHTIFLSIIYSYIVIVISHIPFTGWEAQLLEIGFLALVMVPLFSLRQFPRGTPTPWVAVWANRWLLFRVMIGAVSGHFSYNTCNDLGSKIVFLIYLQGLIKLRGDECWGDLTCMDYHYEVSDQVLSCDYSVGFSCTYVHVLV